MRLETTYEILPADSTTPSHTEVRIENAQGDKFIAFSAPGVQGMLDAMTQGRTRKEALAMVDVKVLDHFIVAGTTPPLSFAERGLL